MFWRVLKESNGGHLS